jgi:hypothetical protein
VREGKAQDEFDRGHPLQLIVEAGLRPAIPLHPGLLAGAGAPFAAPPRMTMPATRPQSGRSVAAHAVHDLPLRKMSDGAILTHKHRESGKAGKKTRRKRPAQNRTQAG